MPLLAALALALSRAVPAAELKTPVVPARTAAPALPSAVAPSLPLPALGLAPAVPAALSPARPRAPEAALPSLAAMSRPSGPEAEPRERLDRAFDAARPGPGFPAAVADLFRGETREASVGAASQLLAVRERHALPSLSRERTSRAVVALRRFRLGLGHALADPAFKTRLRASSSSSARAAKAVAEHVRGAEKNALFPDEGSAGGAREGKVLGLVVEGREEIAAFQEDLDRDARAVRGLLGEFPHEYNMRLRFLRSLTPVLALAALPAMTALGSDLWPAVVAALAVVNEPHAVLPHRLAKDRFARSSRARLEGFLAGREEWLFDSRTYALQGGLVDAALKAGKDPRALREPLWNNDYHGSHGLFSRLMKKLLLRRQASRAPRPAAALGNWTEEERGRWVTVDRLLRRLPDGTPQLVMLIRSSSSRPRFPRPAREASREPLFAPGREPALVPVPVPVPGRRR